MKTAMVKHSSNSKTFWFEVPEELAGEIRDGVRVACDTARGTQYGFVTGCVLDVDSVRDIMVKSGAVFPLRKILSVEKKKDKKGHGLTRCEFPMNKIKVPHCMRSSKPSPFKLSKRFAEYYSAGQFKTRVVVTKSGVLKDGYTAYMAAKTLRLPTLLAEVQVYEKKKPCSKAEGCSHSTLDEIKEKIPDCFYYALGGELVSVFGTDVLEKDVYGVSGLDFVAGTGGYTAAFLMACKKLGMDWLAKYYIGLTRHKSDQLDSEISDKVLKRFRTDMEEKNTYYRFLIGEENPIGNEERA